jgi:hypothetical protein
MKKTRLSALWVFATLNYLYCDLVTLMDPTKLGRFLAGNVGGMQINQGFLLGASLLVEIPIAMVLLSHLLKDGASRWANIVAGLVMTAVQLSTLLVGSPTPYYLFFSAIEIAATSTIVIYAWKRTGDELAQSHRATGFHAASAAH